MSQTQTSTCARTRPPDSGMEDSERIRALAAMMPARLASSSIRVTLAVVRSLLALRQLDRRVPARYSTQFRVSSQRGVTSSGFPPHQILPIPSGGSTHFGTREDADDDGADDFGSMKSTQALNRCATTYTHAYACGRLGKRKPSG